MIILLNLLEIPCHCDSFPTYI